VRPAYFSMGPVVHSGPATGLKSGLKVLSSYLQYPVTLGVGKLGAAAELVPATVLLLPAAPGPIPQLFLVTVPRNSWRRMAILPRMLPTKSSIAGTLSPTRRSPSNQNCIGLQEVHSSRSLTPCPRQWRS
jgi:hypothetical protein